MDGLSGIKVENANQERVSFYVDKIMSESGRYCSCMRCRLDAIALALNTLPPHYYVDIGHIRENAEIGSPWILIEMAAKEALERVLRYPNHQPDDHDTDDLESIRLMA